MTSGAATGSQIVAALVKLMRTVNQKKMRKIGSNHEHTTENPKKEVEGLEIA